MQSRIAAEHLRRVCQQRFAGQPQAAMFASLPEIERQMANHLHGLAMHDKEARMRRENKTLIHARPAHPSREVAASRSAPRFARARRIGEIESQRHMHRSTPQHAQHTAGIAREFRPRIEPDIL